MTKKPLYMYITVILLAFPSMITLIGIQFWAAININSGLSVLLFPNRNLFRTQKKSFVDKNWNFARKKLRIESLNLTSSPPGLSWSSLTSINFVKIFAFAPNIKLEIKSHILIFIFSRVHYVR